MFCDCFGLPVSPFCLHRVITNHNSVAVVNPCLDVCSVPVVLCSPATNPPPLLHRPCFSPLPQPTTPRSTSSSSSSSSALLQAKPSNVPKMQARCDSYRPPAFRFLQPAASAHLVVRHCPHASSLQTRGSSVSMHRSSSSNFKLSLPLEQRQAQATKVLAKHPGKVPVIVERADGATGVEELDRKKYLMPGDLCIWQLESVIRERLRLPEGQNLFLFVREKIVPDLSPTMADMYAQHADDGGFLYITFKAGMLLPPLSPRGAAVRELEARPRKQTFFARFESHPALSLACPSPAFVVDLTAHPLYCLASRSCMQRWEVMFRCRSPSQAHAQQWQHVYGIDVGLQQRSTLLRRAALCELLVLRLMRFRGAYGVRHPLHHATCVVSRRHFLVSKNLADGLFQEGQRLYEQQRFSDAAKSWAQAALLQHAPSHAFLSDMLIDGRPGVGKDVKRALELAAAGAALGCAHSKGALGKCYVHYGDGDEDVEKGHALARESAVAGSCFGQFVVGLNHNHWDGEEHAEAVRWFRLAAVQGHANAQFMLGCMFCNGQGVTQDYAEAVRWFRLAAAQGLAVAQYSLGITFAKGQDGAGQGVEEDGAEAVRWYSLAASQGHIDAQFMLGHMFKDGWGHVIARDRAEAVRWFSLAAAQGNRAAEAALFKLGV